MKKLCCLLVFLSMFSAMPSFAMKVIVNDQKDRVVYTRSNWNTDPYGDMIKSYETTQNAVNYTEKEKAAAETYKPKYVDTADLKELSNNLKPEMIGIKWEYNYDTNDENQENGDNEQISENNSSYEELTPEEIARRNSREAADYYTKDLNDENPDNLIPSGYDY